MKVKNGVFTAQQHDVHVRPVLQQLLGGDHHPVPKVTL
jgi:hypothetical protein